MKKITIYKQRVPLMATATDGINTGEVNIEDEDHFIGQCVEEFEDCVFEQIKLKKLCLQINKRLEINKITFKERT